VWVTPQPGQQPKNLTESVRAAKQVTEKGKTKERLVESVWTFRITVQGVKLRGNTSPVLVSA